MKPPLNILDDLAGCAEVCDEDFAYRIRRTFVDGAHGRSSTTSLICTHETTGEQIKITYERLNADGA